MVDDVSGSHPKDFDLPFTRVRCQSDILLVIGIEQTSFVISVVVKVVMKLLVVTPSVVASGKEREIRVNVWLLSYNN